MKKITKLAIFDFDGTLISTPLPDEAKKIWLEKKGTPWPHEGYWGRHESLDMEVFEMPSVEMVIKDYEEQMAAEDTAVILLTGRMVKLTDHVMAILEAKSLKFDEYHLNRGGATDMAKIKTMEKLLEKYTDVTSMTLWDDRESHIPIFQTFGDSLVSKGRLTNFKIVVVPAGRH